MSQMNNPDPDARKEAARLLGSIRSEKKAEAARRNGALSNGRRPLKPLSEVRCTCGAGDSLEHKGTCPRYKRIFYRRQKGLPLT